MRNEAEEEEEDRGKGGTGIYGNHPLLNEIEWSLSSLIECHRRDERQ